MYRFHQTCAYNIGELTKKRHTKEQSSSIVQIHLDLQVHVCVHARRRLAHSGKKAEEAYFSNRMSCVNTQHNSRLCHEYLHTKSDKIKSTHRKTNCTSVFYRGIF